MADIISDLSTQAGISPDMARKGMGAVLDMCKSKLSPEAFSQIGAAAPGADGMIAAAAATATGDPAGSQPSGGVVSTVTGMIGKLFGGGAGAGEAAGGAELAGRLSQAGFSMDQIKSFLPLVLGFLKDKLPADALQKLSGLIPSGVIDAAQQAGVHR